MKNLFLIILLLFSAGYCCAQQSNALVKKGNDAYKKGDAKTAAEDYKKALEKDKNNKAALFNLGNALQQENQGPDADKAYDEIVNSNADVSLKAKAAYNKGLSLIQQKKLQEAAEAFKQSLKMSPQDNDTRENLQKVLNEIKKQQQQQQQQQNKNKDQKKQQNNKEQQKPKDQQSQPKLSKQKAEQLLNQLREKENQLQNQLQKQKPTNQQQEKDW